MTLIGLALRLAWRGTNAVKYAGRITCPGRQALSPATKQNTSGQGDRKPLEVQPPLGRRPAAIREFVPVPRAAGLGNISRPKQTCF